MDISEAHIIRILKRGLDQGAYTEEILHRIYSAQSPVLNPSNLDLSDLLKIKAHEIQERIENVDALSLSKDANMHNGKEYFWLIFQDAASGYVLSRLLIDELRDAFGLRIADRNSLVEGFLSISRQATPKVIVRSDIGSFFESIDHSRLFRLLEDNGGISQLSIRIYYRIFEEFDRHRFLLIQHGKGLPRGLAVSSYLAEVYLKEIDEEVCGMSGISFYGRYVDDIIVTAGESYGGSATDLYSELRKIFGRSGLQLHDAADGKTSLTDISSSTLTIGEFLGYELRWNHGMSSVVASLPTWKIDRKKRMIDKAFLHFEKVSRYDPKQARRELIDCLNYLSGNFALSGSKRDIITGIHYSNRHLNDFKGLDELTAYIHSRPILPYARAFSSIECMHKYVYRLGRKIRKINFRSRWCTCKTYSFTPKKISRLKAIMKSD